MKRIRRRCVLVCPLRGRPHKRAAIRQHIQFVEQHSTIPQRLGIIVHVRSLPRVDRFAPFPRVQQAVTRDSPGIFAVSAVVIRVYRRYHLRPEPNSVTGKSPRNYHRKSLFSRRGARVNFTAIAARQPFPTAQPRRAWEFDKLPSFANVFHTSLPLAVG